MKNPTGWCLILFFSFYNSILSQKLTGEQAIIMEAMADSAEFFELKDPRKSLQFATTVLQNVPEQGNEVITVRALLYSANSEKMTSNRDAALDYCRRAITIAHRVNNPELLVRSYFMKGSVFGQADEEDSTLVAYQKVIEYYTESIKPYYYSGALINIGKMYARIGNMERGEQYLLKGYAAAQHDEYAQLFALAEVIGFFSSRDDPRYLPYLDTLAMTDFYKNASESSMLAHFDSFLRLDRNNPEQREQKLREVYQYSRANSAYANQVGYGMKLYEFLEDEKRYDEAQVLLEELLVSAKKAGSGRLIAGVTRSLYENSKRRGRLEEAFAYLERHGALRDSLLSDENRETISELNIKYETAQKDLEIAQQKADIEQAHRNRNFLLAVAALLAALAALTFFFFRNKARTTRRIAEQEKIIHTQEKERLLREKEVAELTASLETQERERNRIARDLHDGLGSLMSGISAQIETLRAQPTVEAAGSPYLGQLRDMVKDATAELRRTSYELMPASLLRQGLEPAIRDLGMNLLVKNGIEPTLEINADLTTLNHEQQLTIYRIIQELLNNIVKHAQAKNVLMQFNHYDNEFSLVVEDDGKGFDVAEKKQTGGLGLGSLQSRVNLLKGLLDIASIPGEGTTVTVNFALAEESRAYGTG